VEDAHFHVTQVRGFEKFSEGRPFYEMPSLMARICGICPVSHLIASAKACEAIMSVRIPHTAAQLRRMLNLAQMVQSHALSFFYLASPDLLLGMESDPAAATSSAWSPPSRNWAAPASPCAASASTSSSCWATSAFIPDGSFPAASPSRSNPPSAMRFWP
jgi:Ni,Fe-hydrogenase I large subunit